MACSCASCRRIIRILRSLGQSSPYPDFASRVVVPCAANCARFARARSFNSAGLISRSLRTLFRIPPPCRAISSYVAPEIRCSYSAAREAANTRCVCESTNPGRTTPPCASIFSARRDSAILSIFFRAPIAAIRPSRASKAPSQIISSSPNAFPRRGASPRTVTICPQFVTSRSRFACSRFCIVDIFLRTFTVLKTAPPRTFRAPESCRWNFEHWRILRRTKMTLGEPMARKMFGIKLAVATAAALFVVLIAAGKFARAQNTIAKPSEYNIIIRNGHIIDGTGSPWYSGDIAIRDGRIAAIGDLSRAHSKKTIDAAGRVVAPGFIDMLGQSETTILVDPHVPSKIFQGITTEITGEGDTVAPQNDSTLANLNTECRHYGITCDWRTFTEYFARLQKQGMGINLGTYVGATQVRRVVIGENDVQATPAQLDQMKSLVVEAMREGAMGLSSALEYPPAPYASTDELIALASVASQYGGIYATHMRNEGDGEMEALAETARIGREAHIPVE